MYNGTTQDMTADLKDIEQGLDVVPKLAQKVEKGLIMYIHFVKLLYELASNRR